MMNNEQIIAKQAAMITEQAEELKALCAELEWLSSEIEEHQAFQKKMIEAFKIMKAEIEKELF